MFDHDVLGEFLVADALAGHVIESGRSATTVQALNRVAASAADSASARGVFELLVAALDRTATDLLTGLVSSPIIDLRRTLPLLITTATTADLTFATDDVLRGCAARARRERCMELTAALLVAPSLPSALGERFPAWLNDVLRLFGSTVWTDVATAVEHRLDDHAAAHVLADADLTEPRDAIFFTRHLNLFTGPDADPDGRVAHLVGHPDWRVRAALAEGIDDTDPTRSTLGILARDPDYKVRAAVAATITRIGGAIGRELVPDLLTDDNWHVRACVLRGLLAAPPGIGTPPAIALARDVLAREESWRSAPAHVAPLIARLSLLHCRPHGDPTPDTAAEQVALFGLLREIRTGWTAVPANILAELCRRGQDSASWVVRREAHLEGDAAEEVTGRRAAFRRLRGSRAVQVALDLQDLGDARRVAMAAARSGADLVEVGDPLIKRFGLAAVSEIAECVPDVLVVAEMMSADWGRDQVELAASAGADAVLLIGLSTPSSIALAAEAGRRLGVPVLLDVPPERLDREWVQNAERGGVDAFVVTTNIDVGIRGEQPLERADQLRDWTALPVFVSGGFDTGDHDVVFASDWDVLIIGRSIAESVHPERATKTITSLARRSGRRRTA